MTATSATSRIYWAAAALALVAMLAVALVALAHGSHATLTVAPAASVHLRAMAIPPIHPLPGATPAEWATYLQAKASYCALQPAAAICS